MYRFLFIYLLLILSCKETNQENKTGPATKKDHSEYRVKIIPLGKIDKKKVDDLYASIKNILPATEVVAHEPMPELAYYKPRNRYRADSIIRWLRNRVVADEVWLGLTSQDISTTKNDNPDSGVMGLGFQPGKSCIASDYRLRNKKSLFKIAIHELGHTTGLSHCPEKNCYMRDAKGGNPTDEETGFCSSCKKHLLSKGWIL